MCNSGREAAEQLAHGLTYRNMYIRTPLSFFVSSVWVMFTAANALG
jgi:hypothetical protein